MDEGAWVEEEREGDGRGGGREMEEGKEGMGEHAVYLGSCTLMARAVSEVYATIIVTTRVL